jgi:tetratricopeptide (TPR) repeat protein
MIAGDLPLGPRRAAMFLESTDQDQRTIMNYSSRLSAFCDRVIEASWLAALILAPLFFNVYSSRVFEPDKITIVRSLALIMVGAWIVKWLEERGRNPDRPDRVTWRTPLMLPTLVFVIVYIIASALSIVPRVSILGSYQRLQGMYSMFSYIVIFWMIVMTMRRREQLDRFVTVVVMTSLPIAFYGLIQHANKDPLPWGGDVTQRVASNMGNPIFVAAYLIMAFFLTMGRLIESFRVILTEKESRISDILRASVYLFVGALQLIAFGFADSRGPLLGWLPGMFIFGLVGLLLLRVSLHSTAAKAALSDQANPDEPIEEQYPIKPVDVFKALGMALVSIGGAAVGAGLTYVLFPPPQFKITLLVMGALLGGLVPLLLAVGIRRSAARWLWASWILFAAVGAAGLFLINFSDHPIMVGAQQSGAFGRLSSLLESEGGTGKVRSLIWEGAVKLVTPHDPLLFPDGSQDNLNVLRPLIGYGPESMYVAYNRFYPPDLAHYEARNASPDRSHNETWDSFVNTGAVGFAIEQWLFLAVFFYALKFIGWIPNRRAAVALGSMMVAGGIVGALGLGLAVHPNFMGAGWPAGVTAGLVLYVIAFALFHFKISRSVYILIAALLIGIIDLAIFGATFTSANRLRELMLATGAGIGLFAVMYAIGRYVFNPTAGQPIEMSGHIFTIVALFGAILAHYLEISLAGIAIASTRTYFWAYAGLLVVLGLHWVPAEDTETRSVPAPIPAARPETSAPVNKKKTRRVAVVNTARPQPKRDHYSTSSLWMGPVLALALASALILGTLGFEFINSTPGSTAQGAIELIVKSLTVRPYANNESSYGALLMFLVTWFFGGLLTLTELRRRNMISARDIWLASALYYGVSIAVAGFYWLLQAGQILGFSGLVPQTQVRTLQELAQRSTSLVSFADAISNLLTMFYLFVAIIIFSMAAVMLLEVRGRLARWVHEWSLVAVIPIGLVALIGVTSTNLNPVRADIVYKQAEAIRNSGQIDLAIAHFKRARELNPDEDFYHLWLGAAFLDKASTPQNTASLLTDATTIDGLMNLNFESTYQLNQADSLTAAQIVLLHARALNPLNTDHSANLARLHRRWADLKASDPAARQQELEAAANYYQEATNLSPNNAQLWNEWGLINLAMSDLAQQTGDTAKTGAYLSEAQAKLDHSLELDAKYDQTYLLQAQLARAQGNAAEAQKYFEYALQLNAGSLDAWSGAVDQLIQTQNYTDAERISLAFLEKNPNSLPVMRTLARNIYYPQGRLDEAFALMQQVLPLAANDPNLWNDSYVTAVLLAQSGRLPEALPLAQQALEQAPQEQKAGVQQLITQLQQQLGISPQPTGTLPFQPPK